MIAIVVGCCGRSHPDIWKVASFGPVYTRASGGVLKQQLNDLLLVVVPMSTVPYGTKVFII